MYRIVYQSLGKVVELYARQVTQGGLFGFIEVEELVFGAKSDVVVDPSEEGLRSELDGVKRLYLPMHSILRIDEVEKEGRSRLRQRSDDEKDKDKDSPIVRAFPVPFFPPKGD